jgi:S-adenosylmethionine:tRNA ribosyltransferase-isomerase
MIPATLPQSDPSAARLLVVDAQRAAWEDARIADLGSFLRAGDLLVVNDAATLPASHAARTSRGDHVELRLAGRLEDGRWRAVLFGEGTWRTRTEDRRPPPRLARGDQLFLDGLCATVTDVDSSSPRLVEIRLEGDPDLALRALYRSGKYVQYAYTARELESWDVQNAYASEPWASEMPSAGRNLNWGILLSLRKRGVRIASITHAAGLSSTGEPRLDASLPLPERFRIREATVAALRQVEADGGRVIAVGTTVARALEGSALLGDGRPSAGEGTTDLVIGPGFRPRVVHGLLTGLHEHGTSHRSMTEAFAPRALLEQAHAHAERLGYLCHEFGDSALVLGD